MKTTKRIYFSLLQCKAFTALMTIPQKPTERIPNEYKVLCYFYKH